MHGVALAGSVRDATPRSVESLLPEADLVVAARDREHVAGDAPAEMPDDVLERVERLRSPGARGAAVAHPDDHATILELDGKKEEIENSFP